MPKTKIAITLDDGIVGRIDMLVLQRAYPNRSQAIEEAVREKLDRLGRFRLAREVSKLDPEFERSLAEEGLSQDQTEWPEY
ncbi:MAG TPA: ribbon-helix-helix domain-containing protein [Candidatus Thermoplasmatota archaeon]|nr:ribbon-helix-helix domain-containing protein [Candidatus Thermoplasmatota archaeon]